MAATTEALAIASQAGNPRLTDHITRGVEDPSKQRCPPRSMTSLVRAKENIMKYNQRITAWKKFARRPTGFPVGSSRISS